MDAKGLLDKIIATIEGEILDEHHLRASNPPLYCIAKDMLVFPDKPFERQLVHYIDIKRDREIGAYSIVITPVWATTTHSEDQVGRYAREREESPVF